MQILKVFVLLFSFISGMENKEEKDEKRGPLQFPMNLNCQMMPGYLKTYYFQTPPLRPPSFFYFDKQFFF